MDSKASPEIEQPNQAAQDTVELMKQVTWSNAAELLCAGGSTVLFETIAVEGARTVRTSMESGTISSLKLGRTILQLTGDIEKMMKEVPHTIDRPRKRRDRKEQRKTIQLVQTSATDAVRANRTAFVYSFDTEHLRTTVDQGEYGLGVDLCWNLWHASSKTDTGIHDHGLTGGMYADMISQKLINELHNTDYQTGVIMLKHADRAATMAINSSNTAKRAMTEFRKAHAASRPEVNHTLQNQCRRLWYGLGHRTSYRHL